MDLEQFTERLMMFVPVLLSLTVHEWAHAWAAWQLGDDTAKRMGRLTLNPLAHMDPVGTFLLPLMGVPFGWAKPVPVNPLQFTRNVSLRFGMLLVAAAGPISNAILAILSWLGLRLILQPQFAGLLPSLGALPALLFVLIQINIALGLFNLFPIPPLDGSKIVDGLVPDSLRPLWNRYCALGPFLLFGLIVLPLLLNFSPVGEGVKWAMRLFPLN
jgi:Zn-dependent protease